MTTLSLTIGRLWLAACLSATCVGAVEAQADQSQPSKEQIAKYLAIQAEIQRELRGLQPLFPHLGLQILLELRELEKRPEARPGAWAELMRRRHTFADAPYIPPIVLAEDFGGGGVPPESMSADEKIVRWGGVQRLLIRLAVTGRISEQEYNSFLRRLRGN